MRISTLVESGKLNKIRELVSAGLRWLSIILLLLSLVSVAHAWMHAFRENRVPEVWGIYEGNHGPWRHYYTGRESVMYAVSLPLKSFFYSVLSVLIKKSLLGIWLIIISALYFFLVMYTHYWLID
jgi:hypothetical protein